MKSIEEFVIEKLKSDDRYIQVLSGTQDETARQHIDATVKAFVHNMSSVFDSIIESMKDPDVRRKLEEKRRK